MLTRDGLTNILEHYAQVVETTDPKTGKKRRVQIWPRYHQLDVVRRLLADTHEHGAGKRYLIQHSAGSVRCGSPATLCARPREGRERSWQAVDCPVTPRTEAETTDSGAAAGHRRHPWPCAWRVGTGWRVRPRRRDRAPWAGGGPDGGRRAPGDRRASRDHRPLMAR